MINKKKVADIKVTELENGVLVATESLPNLHSASLGVYLDIGSRDESAPTNGLAHLFEHMVFKGTDTHSALELVKSYEASGGHVNAFTSKEQTCFYAKMVDSEAMKGLSLLLDMALNATFDEEELRKEKDVIIEEIKGGNDNPEDSIYDLLSDAFYGKQGLGFPIAGDEKTVAGLTRAHLSAHRDLVRRRLPVFVIGVGNLSHAETVRVTREAFGLPRKQGAGAPIQSRRPLARRIVACKPRHLIDHKSVQQVNIMLSGPGYAFNAQARFPLILINTIFGDGMSSRLFQNLREEYGLVYSIYSNPEFLIGSGLFTIGFATEPAHLQKALREIAREIKRLKNEGLSAPELEFAKANVRGSILLSLESTQSRMSHIARRLLNRKDEEPLEATLQRLDAVTQKDVQVCLQRVFAPEKWASAAIAPKKTRVPIVSALNF